VVHQRADGTGRQQKRFGSHPNIVGYLGAVRRELPETRAVEFFVLMEYCPGGHVWDAIQRRQGSRFPEPELANMFEQVCRCEARAANVGTHCDLSRGPCPCRAVQLLHSQDPPVAHRDLKVKPTAKPVSLAVRPLCACVPRAGGEHPAGVGRAHVEALRLRQCNHARASLQGQGGHWHGGGTDPEVHHSHVSVRAPGCCHGMVAAAKWLGGRALVTISAPEMVDLYRHQLVNEKVDVWVHAKPCAGCRGWCGAGRR
jgi:hypothetical protein